MLSNKYLADLEYRWSHKIACYKKFRYSLIVVQPMGASTDLDNVPDHLTLMRICRVGIDPQNFHHVNFYQADNPRSEPLLCCHEG